MGRRIRISPRRHRRSPRDAPGSSSTGPRTRRRWASTRRSPSTAPRWARFRWGLAVGRRAGGSAPDRVAVVAVAIRLRQPAADDAGRGRPRAGHDDLRFGLDLDGPDRGLPCGGRPGPGAERPRDARDGSAARVARVAQRGPVLRAPSSASRFRSSSWRRIITSSPQGRSARRSPASRGQMPSHAGRASPSGPSRPHCRGRAPDPHGREPDTPRSQPATRCGATVSGSHGRGG